MPPYDRTWAAFIVADIARLAILLAIPGISLWVPARME
jgi:hypothetical protein